jgi:hypothetical protein
VEQRIPRYLAPAQIPNVSVHLFIEGSMKDKLISYLALHLLLPGLAPLLLRLHGRC